MKFSIFQHEIQNILVQMEHLKFSENFLQKMNPEKKIFLISIHFPKISNFLLVFQAKHLICIEISEI